MDYDRNLLWCLFVACVLLDCSRYPYLVYFRSKDTTDEDILKEIKKCTKNVNSNLVEQTAYIRACAAKKNLDLDKFKAQVQQEMKVQDECDKGL